MITCISCQKKDMLFVNYEAPDGIKRHNRLWNGGNGAGRIRLYEKRRLGVWRWKWALLDDIDAKNTGCEYGEYSN